MRKILYLLGLLILAAAPAAAQFIGFTSPQSQQQTLATNLLCTGSAQIFPINNRGQTQHYLSVANITGATQFQAVIQGIDRQGNIFPISDVMEPISNGNLSAAGYFPQMQVQVICSPNTATFTASYSGAWGTFNTDAGSYLTAQMDKQDFAGASASANQSDTFQTPFGSSGGTIYFKYVTSTVTGSTLTVSCTSAGGALNQSAAYTVTIAPLIPVQVFQIPDQACPTVTVAYTSGGAGATFNTEYLFAVPGISNHASADPCQSGIFPKSTAVLFAPAAATTQQIAAVTGSSIYVCGITASLEAAGTFQLANGTGANCGTGTTNISGPLHLASSTPVNLDSTGFIAKVPISNALCVVTTGAGAIADGLITFIQSP